MRPLVATQAGIMILVYAATSAIVGYLILKRIANIDV
jgi:Flp pilus assembly protein TadB